MIAALPLWTFAAILAVTTDGTRAALLGALVAGLFSLVNTLINARILKRANVNADLVQRLIQVSHELLTRLNEKRVSIRDEERDLNIVAYEPDLERRRGHHTDGT